LNIRQEAITRMYALIDRAF